MSDAIPTRLCFYDGHGIARHDGVTLELRQAPPLPGDGPVHEVDYSPSMVAQIRRGFDGRRDMLPAEAAAALALLRGMAEAARSAIAAAAPRAGGGPGAPGKPK